VRSARVVPSGTAGPVSPGSLDLLPASWRRHLCAIVTVSAAWSGGWAVAVHGGRRPLALERPLNDLLTARKPQLVHVAEAFVSINKPLVFAALMIFMLVLCTAGRSPRAAVTLAGALTVTLVLVEVLKHVVGRVNTYGLLTFPSGHVAVTSVLATLTVLLARRRGPLGRHLPVGARVVLMIATVGSVIAVGLSMVILGGHFVTDTIAAAPIGVSVTLVTAAGADAFSRAASPPRSPDAPTRAAAAAA
jgi:membrane-associated phospholipid phosphatase